MWQLEYEVQSEVIKKNVNVDFEIVNWGQRLTLEYPGADWDLVNN